MKRDQLSIAKIYKIPSCFYDPTESLISCKDQTHNIELIKGKEKLSLWLKNL